LFWHKDNFLTSEKPVNIGKKPALIGQVCFYNHNEMTNSTYLADS